jgi:hypothetical protein
LEKQRRHGVKVMGLAGLPVLAQEGLKVVEDFVAASQCGV